MRLFDVLSGLMFVILSYYGEIIKIQIYIVTIGENQNIQNFIAYRKSLKSNLRDYLGNYQYACC